MSFKSIELKVGILIVSFFVLLLILFVLVAKGPNFFTSSKTIWFDIDNANGLIKNGRVKVSGISVGIIDKIQLVSGKARIYMKLDANIPLTTSSEVRIVPQGILGDKYIEIIPGQPNDPLIENGGSIYLIHPSVSFSSAFNLFSESFSSIKKTSDTLQELLKGKLIDQDASVLERIIKNMDIFAKHLKEFSEQNIDKMNAMMIRLNRVVQKLSHFTDEEGFENLESSLRKMDDITQQIREGKGTLGRLVYDEDTAEEINQTLVNINDILGNLSQFKTSIDIHTEYLTKPNNYKSFLNLKVQPGLDRHYEFQLVNDFEGVRERVTTLASSGNGSISRKEEETIFQDKWKISALFVKHFYDFEFKAGIIENAEGIGMNYHLMNKKMKLGLELFDINDANLRAFLRVNLFNSIYLIGGGNHILKFEDKASAFLGAGVFFTNEDIKTFISKIPL